MKPITIHTFSGNGEIEIELLKESMLNVQTFTAVEPVWYEVLEARLTNTFHNIQVNMYVLQMTTRSRGGGGLYEIICNDLTVCSLITTTIVCKPFYQPNKYVLIGMKMTV